MTSIEVIPLITHLYFAFENNKRIKGIPSDINVLN
jgi:hypothetical protein